VCEEEGLQSVEVLRVDDRVVRLGTAALDLPSRYEARVDWVAELSHYHEVVDVHSSGRVAGLGLLRLSQERRDRGHPPIAIALDQHNPVQRSARDRRHLTPGRLHAHLIPSPPLSAW